MDPFGFVKWPVPLWLPCLCLKRLAECDTWPDNQSSEQYRFGSSFQVTALNGHCSFVPVYGLPYGVSNHSYIFFVFTQHSMCYLSTLTLYFFAFNITFATIDNFIIDLHFCLECISTSYRSHTGDYISFCQPITIPWIHLNQRRNLLSFITSFIQCFFVYFWHNLQLMELGGGVGICSW